MNSQKLNYILFINLVSTCYSILACGNYKFEIKSMKNCQDDNVITFSKDYSLSIDEDCNVTPTGCITVKPFSSFQMTYKVIKPPLPPITGDMNVCEEMPKYAETYGEILDTFAMPKSCPAEASNKCFDGKKSVSLAAIKNKLGMAIGKTKIILNSVQDTGETCIEIDVEVKKLKKKKH